MKKRLIFWLFIAIFLILTGCCPKKEKGMVNQKTPNKEAQEKCMALCREKKGILDLSHGPCLSNEIIDDWVCDVAHNPRQPVDNQPENQCVSFREGRAHHFIEVDPDCNFIKSY